MTTTGTLGGEVEPPITTDTARPASSGRALARSRPRSLRRRLVPPFLAAGSLYVVLALGDRLPAVDGLAYFEAGRNLLGGEGYTRLGEPELHFPPLVPVSLRLLELATGSEMAALGVWNVSMSLALVGVMVALAHRLWRDERVTVATAWLAGAMAGLGPLFFRYGSGSEHVAVVLLLGAVLVALPFLEGSAESESGSSLPGRHRWLVASGVLVGVAYLARPETLLPGLLIPVAVMVAGWRRAHPVRSARWRGAATNGGAFLLGCAVCVGPYVVYLHDHTQSWSPTAKTKDVSIDAWRAAAEGDRLERDRYVYALSSDGTSLPRQTYPLTELAKDHPMAWLAIVKVNALRTAWHYVAPTDLAPTWRLLPAPLLVPAALALWRDRRKRTTWLLAGVAAVPLTVNLVFFALPRYLVLPTAVLTLFAASGLVGWARSLDRPWRAALGFGVAVVVGLSTLSEVRSFLPEQRTADPIMHVWAARWLAENTPEDARVMTRSFHVQAYADRPVVAMPAADYLKTLNYARLMGVNYVVVYPRTPLYPVLLTSPETPGLRLVAEFGRRNPVRIYELDPAPPPSDREPTPLGYVGDA